MIELLYGAALNAMTAPQLRCDVETPVWCVLNGDESLSMHQVQDDRVWTIILPWAAERITIKESLSCGSVRDGGGLEATTLSEKRNRVPGGLKTDIIFEVPGYGCEVTVAWNSPIEDLTREQGQFRHDVLVKIMMGVGEKRPLLDLVRGLCLDSGGIWASGTNTCSLDEPTP